MTHADERAGQLFALHGGKRAGPEWFDELNHLVFELRHLHLSIAAEVEEPPQLSNLPSDQAQVLFELVRVAGAGYASTSIFIEISNALRRPGPGS